MKETMKVINIEAPIVINGELFIIPNRAHRHTDFLAQSVQKEKLETMQDICDINGMEYDPLNHKIVQCWYLSDEFFTDNIACHHIKVKDEDDGRTYIICSIAGSYLPSTLFEGKEEGDVISFCLPVNIIDESNEIIIKHTAAIFNFTLNQSKFRYRGFGSFQEAFKLVMR